MSTIEFGTSGDELRQFAQLIASLQEQGVRFTVDRSGVRYLINISSGE